MRYLTLRETLEIYQRVMQQSGGLIGIRDLGALESSGAPVDEQEKVILQIASGEMNRHTFAHWLDAHVEPKGW
jgi:prophage maintenance system killer protein